MKKSCFFASLAVLLFCLTGTVASAAITINTAFPGGNALVDKTEGSSIYLRPDLRGGKAWFYWYFEAQASQPERATFVLSASAIGVRGPAISRDGGKNWQWLGADRVTALPAADPAGKKPAPALASFDYEFTKAGERVRFSVGIPYVQSDFDAFMASRATSPYLSRSVLTKSLKGRPVEFLQIGKPGPGKLGLLLTARHHACEAMASYVLEGFLNEAMSESPAAVRFREKYVLYAMPFVDKDGVEDGDQGKDRAPHDHNRDYGDAPMYPEVKAIQEFAARTPIQVSVDLHCPALRGDIHEAFHFLGLGVPHVKDNLDEWITWIDEEKPPVLGTPIDYLVDGTKPAAVNKSINAHYFAIRKEALMAATLEIPYTQPNVPLDANLGRQYGAGLLRALNRPAFITGEPGSTRGAGAHAELVAWRKKFAQTYRSTPEVFEELAKPYLADPQTAPVFRIETQNMMAALRFSQRRYAESLPYSEAVLKNEAAMTSQRIGAMAQRQRTLAADPKTAPADFEAALAQALKTPSLTDPQQVSLLTPAVDFYQARGEYSQAVAYGRKLFPVAAYYEKGRTLLRIATLQDLQKQPGEALATRQEAIALLHKLASPKPSRSAFGAMIATDLFDAVMAVPTSTLEERQAAADIALNHEIVAEPVKARIRKAMAAPQP